MPSIVEADRSRTRIDLEDWCHRQSLLDRVIIAIQVLNVGTAAGEETVMNAVTELSERHYVDSATLPMSLVKPEVWIVAEAVTDEYVHPGAIAIGLGGFVLFLIASWIGWSFDYTSTLIGVGTGLGAIYFGLLIGLGQRCCGSQ